MLSLLDRITFRVMYNEFGASWHRIAIDTRLMYLLSFSNSLLLCFFVAYSDSPIAQIFAFPPVRHLFIAFKAGREK